jgi:hypothetical protein
MTEANQHSKMKNVGGRGERGGGGGGHHRTVLGGVVAALLLVAGAAVAVSVNGGGGNALMGGRSAALGNKDMSAYGAIDPDSPLMKLAEDDGDDSSASEGGRNDSSEPESVPGADQDLPETKVVQEEGVAEEGGAQVDTSALDAMTAALTSDEASGAKAGEGGLALFTTLKVFGQSFRKVQLTTPVWCPVCM